jgi:hypothetical protein
MSLSFGSAPKVSSGDNCDEATKAAASVATEAAPAPPPRPTNAVSLIVLSARPSKTLPVRRPS